MGEQLDYRSYDDFDTRAIYTSEGTHTNNAAADWPGWKYDFSGIKTSTPITDSNLNAMLYMLIYIRNVIGKTTDFVNEINGSELEIIPNPDALDNKSIATYIKEVTDAIIGEGDNADNTQITKTLSGLKSYLESLDVSNENNTEEINNSADNKWVNKVTQTDGKINVEYTRPDASDIAYTLSDNDINIKEETDLASVVRKLDSVINSIREALSKEKEARETSDNELQTKIDQEVSSVNEDLAQEIIDRQNAVNALLGNGSSDTTCTIKKNAAAIEALNKADGENKAAIEHIEDTYATKAEVSAIELLDSKVKMSDNLRITESFGRYNPDIKKGYIDIYCKDKTVRDFLIDALQVASVGNIDLPSYTYTTDNDKYEGEIGSKYSAPTCTFKVTDVGSYQYGPATGITFSGKLTTPGDTDDIEVSFKDLTKNGTKEITAKSGGVYSTTSKEISFGGTYSYTNGATPNTNIGTTDNNKYIKAVENQDLSYSCTYTGYYKMFMGIGDASNLNSDTIRDLTSVNDKETKTTEQVDASINDISIIWAIRKDFTSNKPTFKYELFGNYETLEGVVGPAEVAVKDGGGKNDVIYNVYTYTPAAGKFTAAMKTKITIN